MRSFADSIISHFQSSFIVIIVCFASLLHIRVGLSSNLPPDANMLYTFPQSTKENSEMLDCIFNRALQHPYVPQIFYYSRLYNYSVNKASFNKYPNEYIYINLISGLGDSV
jgi:hypothetical protein